MLIELGERSGPYCLIGGLAVNCYVEPVYTLDADVVLMASALPRTAAALQVQCFEIEDHPHMLNARSRESDLRI